MPRPKRPTRRPGVKRSSGVKRRGAVNGASSRKRAPKPSAQKKTLTLPVVAPTESAREALRLMREYGRSGVLSNIGGWRLYEAAHVVITLSENPAAPLSAVPSRRTAASVGPDGSVAVVIETTGGKYGGRGQRRRGASPAGAAVPAIDRAQAQMLAAGPRDCYCRVDYKPVAGGSSGDDCPNGHRGSVRCV